MTNSTETGMETRFDGNSELVAELATVNGFKAAYAIKDGAEGPRGWMVCNFFSLPFSFYWRIHILYEINSLSEYFMCGFLLQSSGLPWLAPSKALSIDFSNIKDAIDSLGVCQVVSLL